MLAAQVGFEPTTVRLTADSSTTELLWKIEYGGPNHYLTLIRRAF